MDLERDATDDGVRSRRVCQHPGEREQGWPLGGLHLAPQEVPLAVELESDFESVHLGTIIARRHHDGAIAVASRADDWLEQARSDLDLARVALREGHFDWACFAAQQASEKAVKAVFQSRGAEAWGHAVA